MKLKYRSGSYAFVGLVAWLFGIASAGPATAQAEHVALDPNEIDAVVSDAMSTFQVPGMAVGVVQDGELTFARGYGVRKIGTNQPVDADTLFGIASNTKAMTAAALAILVDEGKLSWDDHVIDHIPEFQLFDPYVTREFTIRDLLTHRSGLGLGAGDLMIFPPTDYTIDEIIGALKYLKPVTSFRSAYAYDNQLYIVAGEIVARTSGMSWAEFIEQRVLQPVGATACRALPGRAADNPNQAAPHAVVDDEIVAVTPYDQAATGAAGGVQCNITGLAKWLTMQLNDGKLPDGTALFSAERHRDMWTPQTIRPLSNLARQVNGTHFSTYGLGWGLEDYHGELRVSHTGGLPGMVTYISLLPEEDAAVMVLTNQQSGLAMVAVMTYIQKKLLGAPDQDWVETFANIGEQQEAQFAEAETETQAVLDSAEGEAPLPLSAYAGTYHDDWRGDIWVREENGGLVMEFSRTSQLIGDMQYFRGNTFVVRWRDRSLFADAFVLFELDYDGGIKQATMRAISDRTDFSFDFHDLLLERVTETE